MDWNSPAIIHKFESRRSFCVLAKPLGAVRQPSAWFYNDERSTALTANRKHLRLTGIEGLHRLLIVLDRGYRILVNRLNDIAGAQLRSTDFCADPRNHHSTNIGRHAQLIGQLRSQLLDFD